MAAVQPDLITIDKIPETITRPYKVEAALLRLDRIHPIISGNKWFKLRLHVEQALLQSKKRLVTWGGTWSNHIVATAAACQENGLASLGLIRGEEPNILSATLNEAKEYGMKFYFLSREDYRNKRLPSSLLNDNDWLVPEGGYGEMGARGAAAIMDYFSPSDFTHLLCAVGTGTTMSGLINGLGNKLSIIGIPALKGVEALRTAIHELTNPAFHNWKLMEGFEWGGYAKHPEELIQFMNEFYTISQIQTDIIYTGKLCYAFTRLMKANYFPPHSSVLIIHSGGLQGNRSLQPGTLSFK